MPASAEPERPDPRELPPERASALRDDGALRARALQRLLPPLVHRLNNSLAVLQGVHELGARAGGEERELARGHVEELGRVLGRLALFAREPSAKARAVPLDELAAGLELLLAPLAESRGVALELAFRAEGTLEVDARFEHLFLTAACELVAERVADGAPRPRVRVTARASGDALLLALGSSAAPGCMPALDALAEDVRGRGWPCVRRDGALGTVLRVRVPALALEPRTTVAAAGVRVLLLAPPGEGRELVEMLLGEHGFGVVAAAEAPARGVFDLALVESGAADADPGLAARLTARYGLARVVRLEPNPRPDELLRRLRERE